MQINNDGIREGNLNLLKQKNDKLYQLIVNHTPKDIGEVIPTRSVPNLRFRNPGNQYTHLYAGDDPIALIEQQMPILHNSNDLNQTVCIFTGMGLGHNLLIAHDYRPDIFRIFIIEPSLDIFCLAIDHVDLSPLLLSDKVEFFIGEIDWKEFDTALSNKSIETDFLFSDNSALFDWQPQLYNNAKNRANACAVRAISGLGVINTYGEQIFVNRFRNLSQFRNSYTTDVLKGAFRNIPVLLVSAGPSLDKSMELIKKATGHCIIIAVDSAAVPLIKNDIIPDFVTTLDYREHNSEKLSPNLIGDASFSLVSTISSSPLSSKRIPLKNLFFSFQDNDTQSWLIETLNVKNLMPPVGTVASLALSFAQLTGADPVIMAGYDFAITSEETDHVNGVVFNHGWHLDDKTITVKGVKGGYVKTLNFLLEFKQNFEEVLTHHKRNYINATASGAHIEGTSVMDLQYAVDIYMTQTVEVDEIISAAIDVNPSVSLSDFIESARKQILTAQKTMKQVNTIIGQNEILKRYVKQKNIPVGITKFSQLPSSIQSSKQKIFKLHSKLHKFMPMEELAAKKIHEAKKVQALDEVKNYVELVSKEVRMVGLEMEGHKHGLITFINTVEKLVDFLKREEHLIDKCSKDGEDEKQQLLELARLYIEHEDSIKALKILEQYRYRYSPSPEFLINMGIVKAQQLNLDAALNLWESAIEMDSGYADEIRRTRQSIAEYWLSLPRINQSMDEFYLSRALTIWGEEAFIEKLKDNYWQYTTGIVRDYIKNNRLEKAESFLSLWAPVKESTPEWFQLMAELYNSRENSDKALHYIESALEKEPENGSLLAFSARIQLEVGRFDIGISTLEKAVSIDPLQATLWEELGDTLFSSKDYMTAAIAYEKCFIAIPDRIDSLRKMGDCYFQTGQFEAARAAYQAVLKKKPADEAAGLKLKAMEFL